MERLVFISNTKRYLYFRREWYMHKVCVTLFCAYFPLFSINPLHTPIAVPLLLPSDYMLLYLSTLKKCYCYSI